MSFEIILNNKTFHVEKKAKILDFTKNDKNIICALVNKRIRELDYEINNSCEIKLLSLKDHPAMGIYERGIRYVFVMAAYNLYPKLKFKLTYSISRSIFAQIVKRDGKTCEISDEMVNEINKEMHRIINEDYRFERKRVTIEEANNIYKKYSLYDKKSILKYRKDKIVHIYICNNYVNYMYGKMVPSTGYLSKFNIHHYLNGIIIQYPRSEYNGEIPPFSDEPIFRNTLLTSQKWNDLVNLYNVATINNKIPNKEAVKLINICENRHNRMLSELGERIEKSIDDIRVICIAGPSSSGKTTFADRLTMELFSRGINPIRISLDDYYLDKEDIPLDEDGEPDFEHLKALNIDLFNQNINDLLTGKEVALPTYSFKTRIRDFNRIVKIDKKNPIIVEGIHALNEEITRSIPKYLKFKIYISPQAQINIDNANPISLTDIRLIRRMVRDYKYRNSPAEETIKMWPSVRKGEFKWIYNTQEYADYVFDSFLSYELCIMKKYALPILEKIDRDSQYGSDAQRLIKLLKYFKTIDEKWIPCNSILKEFIGGSSYRDGNL